LASDSAWARSAGAAKISNAPTAASPRSLVTFICISLGVIGCHVSAALPIESVATTRQRPEAWGERRECEVNTYATDMNADGAKGFPLRMTNFSSVLFKTGLGWRPYLLQLLIDHRRLSWHRREKDFGYRPAPPLPPWP
jgi:hypothetical protein